MTLEAEYRVRYERVLKPLAQRIEREIQSYFADEPRIDRITARAKSVDRFLEKSQKVDNGEPRYEDPLKEIQDQVGARVVVFYEDDVSRVSDIVNRCLRPIETKSMSPDDRWKFGYFG